MSNDPIEMSKSRADALRSLIDGKDAGGIVEEVVKYLGTQQVVLASSLSVEDQVLTDLICGSVWQPRICTLDTGRLHSESYDTMEQSMERYGFRYEVLAPDTQELEQMVQLHGPNLFYRSVDLRKKCCAVRKLHPLKRTLSRVDAWICGLRRGQAVTRTAVEPIEWDSGWGILKVNPLYDWTESDVWRFIRKHNVPYNKLQDKGFRSIGCSPCTRAIGPDDDVRAGRWWWEDPEHKECGLHRKRESGE